MFAIFSKEINLFFSSLMGYMAIVVFLLATGLFLWIFPDTSVVDYGFATLQSLFELAPYIFMFLVPAICMRSFSEEYREGTIELITTKPLRDRDIILGKYLATIALIIFALLPTLVYFFSVWWLGMPRGNVDSGGVWGSYLGLLFLGSSFAAIGLFCSSLTSNQIVAFVSAVFLSFLLFQGFSFVSGLSVFFGTLDSFVEQLGMSAHYDSMSRGVIDTRDLAYFFSLIALFLFFTGTALESRKW